MDGLLKNECEADGRVSRDNSAVGLVDRPSCSQNPVQAAILTPVTWLKVFDHLPFLPTVQHPINLARYCQPAR